MEVEDDMGEQQRDVQLFSALRSAVRVASHCHRRGCQSSAAAHEDDGSAVPVGGETMPLYLE